MAGHILTKTNNMNSTTLFNILFTCWSTVTICLNYIGKTEWISILFIFRAHLENLTTDIKSIHEKIMKLSAQAETIGPDFLIQMSEFIQVRQSSLFLYCACVHNFKLKKSLKIPKG